MEGKMKAAVLHGINDLRIEEVEIPRLDEHDVLVRVSACGVCGSDLPRILTQGTYHFPTIPGHEFGGEVVAIGSCVKQNLLHKNVAVIPLIPCRTCKSCEVGDFAQCENYDFLGSRSDGGFAEYVKVPEENLVIMPDQVKPETAAFLEPISVALHVVSNTGVNFGDDVVVFGLGAIGIFVAQWAKAFGASHVFAVDLDPKKVEIARQLGLTDAVCGSIEEVREIVEKATSRAGCDVVFEACGAPVVFNQAMQLLKQNGRFGPVGRPVRDLTVSVKTYETILRRQLTIKGTWSFEFKRFPHNAWDISLEALQKGIIQTDAIISHRFPLAKTKDAVDLMAEKKEFFYKILIVPNEGTLNIKHIHDKNAS